LNTHPEKSNSQLLEKGTASKQQIAAMLKHILAMSEEPEYLDATDGLAVAVCHYMQKSYGDNNETYNDWAGFVKKNPDKVK
jgi:crossover junction endodeoxyribonuclease RuvC